MIIGKLFKTRLEHVLNIFLINLEQGTLKMQFWAKHKKHPLIASGLNKYCSLMDPKTYEEVRSHTNAAEQSANKSYSVGMRQDLLPAIWGFVTCLKRVLNIF
jgi:hypothetical protein